MILESLEYLRVSVTADVLLDAQPVRIALRAENQATAAVTWQVAAWTGAVGLTRTARLGPGWQTGLVAGTHAVLVKVTDSPEVPAIHAGLLDLR